jgi:hypothetical protein
LWCGFCAPNSDNGFWFNFGIFHDVTLNLNVEKKLLVCVYMMFLHNQSLDSSGKNINVALEHANPGLLDAPVDLFQT